MVKITIKPKRRATGEAADTGDHANRETYLIAATEHLAPLFEKAGAKLPPVRVSVGWPGARGGIKRIGSCWKREASRDGSFQIFISPITDDTTTALATLVHELCHACTDCTGHGADFKALARALGLEGKLTATYAGETLTDRLNALVVDKLGKYPHSALTPEQSGEKKQGTRLVKCICAKSGYTIRTTRQWLVTYGPPLSPVTKTPMKVEGVDLVADEKGGES